MVDSSFGFGGGEHMGAYGTGEEKMRGGQDQGKVGSIEMD